MESGNLINYILGLLLKKIVVPTEFHSQTEAIKDMQKDDVSGLVDSLTDFAVESASVDFRIETENKEFSKILKLWLDEVNKEYKGKIPSGIKPLAKEYFKERWKYSSFPVLKIGEWKKINGVSVPSKMYFVDGGSIYAKDKDKDENLKLINYDYYIGKKVDEKYKLGANTIFAKPYGRWFDKYPTPYLIKRGVYHNYKIIESLKNKETEILDQIIPYLLLIKKGSSELSIQKEVHYSDNQLQAVIDKFQELVDKIQTTNTDAEGKTKAPIRATNFDEEIKHLIPDLSTIFNDSLFAVAEKNILTGLGFIDIAEAVSDSRRESILNPKVFIEEVRDGVEGFKQILKELVFLIKNKNVGHRKYINSPFYITASPVKAFMTDDFKEKIRQLYDRGRISSQTAVELIAEVDFETEVHRREQESKEGIDLTMYPPIRDNREGQGIDIPGEEPVKPKDTDEEDIPDDKKDKIEKENYDISKKQPDLVTAPYKTITDLPPRVKDNLDKDLQRVFRRVFNNAYQQYQNETRAFRVAWSVIKKIGTKGKDGKWHRRRERVNGKLRKVKLTRAMLETVLEQEEKQVIEETISAKKIEIQGKQEKLLDHLLKNIDNKEKK